MNRFMSVVVIPANGRSAKTILLSRWVLVVSFGVLVGLLVFAGFGLMAWVQLKWGSGDALTQERQKRDIEHLKKKVEALIHTQDKLEFYLNQSAIYLPSSVEGDRAHQFHAQLKQLEWGHTAYSPTSQRTVVLLRQHIDQVSYVFAKTSNKLDRLKQDFAFVPSIWPLFGKICSAFGYRKHPVLGEGRLHTGVDISAWVGAPVKATADGIVCIAGWTGNYGYLVKITHRKGFSTIYGHASQVLVSVGQHVKKGQVIAQVGSTGMSTGPHLHYEVRRWGFPIRPDPFLSLNLVAASLVL